MPKRTDINSIRLIGSGPIVIGQACELDYSRIQACGISLEENHLVMRIHGTPTAHTRCQPSIGPARLG